MKILLKNARIYDTLCEHHMESRDILISDGIISQIAPEINTHADKIIRSENLCVSPGWIDIGAFNGEPGYEQREDLVSLKKTGARGGYTYVVPLPNTRPSADSKAAIQYLRSHNNDPLPTKILPLSTATVNGDGQDMAELIDLMEAGAIACTDGRGTKLTAATLMRILQYCKGTGVQYIHYPPQRRLISDGQIHEGSTSVQLGLVGIPAVEEELLIHQAITIAKYLDVNISIQNISTKEALHHISAHDNVIASVPYLNLVKTDNELANFDTNLKVLPPLRDEHTALTLREAIATGTVKCITSNHYPQVAEEKDKEFGLSKFGATGLSTCFAATNTHAPEIPLEQLIHCLSHGGYDMLQLPAPTIQEGEPSILTLFDPSIEITIDQNFLRSKCDNNPFKNQTLKGKILGVINIEQSELFV